MPEVYYMMMINSDPSLYLVLLIILLGVRKNHGAFVYFFFYLMGGWRYLQELGPMWIAPNRKKMNEYMPHFFSYSLSYTFFHPIPKRIPLFSSNTMGSFVTFFFLFIKIYIPPLSIFKKYIFLLYKEYNFIIIYTNYNKSKKGDRYKLSWK